MSDKKKKNTPAPENAEPKKEPMHPAAPEAAAQKDTPVEKEAPAPKEEKAEKEPETFTVTAEQMAQMEALAKLVSDSNEKYLRLAAEYDNYRKRTAKEKETLYSDAKLDTIKPFLEVLDNLERGAAQFEEGDPHRQGMLLICKQFAAVLEKLGVSEIESSGTSFDPQKHNAVMHVEDDALGENTVAEVFQKGYTLGDKVLRFAMVKVAN